MPFKGFYSDVDKFVFEKKYFLSIILHIYNLDYSKIFNKTAYFSSQVKSICEKFETNV